MDYAIGTTLPEHVCLECGTHIPYGERPDKKFCCPDCKNRFHNRRYSGTRNAKLRITHILEKNYSILQSLLESGTTSALMSNLLVAGFNPAYSTCTIRIRGREIHMCFDIRFFQTSSRIYGLEHVSDLKV